MSENIAIRALSRLETKGYSVSLSGSVLRVVGPRPPSVNDATRWLEANWKPLRSAARARAVVRGACLAFGAPPETVFKKPTSTEFTWESPIG
jgi:hypothetical protein